MAQYHIIVNDEVNIPLFHWNGNFTSAESMLYLATNDLPMVCEVFKNLKTLSVRTDTDEEVAYFTQYNGYSNIVYLGENFSEQIGDYVHDLQITLTKVDLMETIERLDQQVNPVIDIESMTLDEYKEYKIGQFSQAGEQLIFKGTDVILGDGSIKNFTYNLEDQSNLLNALFIIDQLDDLTITLPYHSHGEPCELYAALDIIRVYLALQTFSTTTQTLVNMRNNWVRTCESKEEVEAITFDCDLPESWLERAQSVLEPAQVLVDTIRRKYFPDENIEG